jgi:hypothetical protein
MGFQILPLEPGDEDKYDIITITSPARWKPYKFLQHPDTSNHFDDPTDTLDINLNYPAIVNHIHVSQTMNITLSTMDSSQPMIDTKILATAT